MRRFIILAISGIVALLLAALLGSATRQQKTLKDQLVGAWALVSIDYVRANGSRSSTFGENPKGIAFFDGSGNYIIAVMRADRLSPVGTKRTTNICRRMSAFGGKADIAIPGVTSAFDPKRTSVVRQSEAGFVYRRPGIPVTFAV